MVTVPTFTNQVSAQTGGSSPRMDAAAAGYAGVALQRASGQISDQLAEWNHRYAEARRQSDAANLLADTTAQLGDMEFRWSKVADNQAAIAGFNDEATKLRTATLNRIQDPTVAALFSDQFDKEMVSRSEATRKAAFGIESADQRGALDLRLSNYEKQISSASSQPLKDQLMARAQADILSSTSAGWLRADEGAQKLLDFKSNLSIADADRDITTNPELAQQKLLDPKNYPDLGPVKRAQLSDRANTRVDALRSDRIRLAELADHQADRAIKKAGDAAAKDLWGKQQDGTLTRDDIEMQKPVLDPSEYHALIVSQSNLGAQFDDPTTLADLTKDVGSSDFVTKATSALQNHLITNDRFVSLLNTNRSELTQQQPASPYKSGRSLVQTTLEPGQLLDGSAAALAHAGQAQALAEFDDWAVANPNATRADTMAEAQRTIARYQIVNYQNMSLATGLPRFYTGTRDALKTGDLDQAEAATIKAMDAGQLSREQSDLELRKIASWRYILAQKTTPPASGGSQ
jgi:hypothetical protein